MQLISAKHRMFVKRVLPFVVIAGACGWSYWSKRDQPNSLGSSIFVGVVCMLIMLVTLGKGFWRLADVVEDHGDKLVITRWRTRIAVSISNIREMRRESKLAGSEVTLVLGEPSALGTEIAFLAPDDRSSPGIEERLDALARRVESGARRS